MTLRDINPGTEVFIDSNIFIYHFTGVSNECSEFLSRCEDGEIIGITSVNVLLEVLHRLMMIEAVNKKLVKPPNILKKLRSKPEKIRELNEYFMNTLKIKEFGVIIKPIDFEVILLSQSIRAGYGLMVNDSVIIANMKKEGIVSLASNDKEFQRIEGISLYSPSDIDW